MRQFSKHLIAGAPSRGPWLLPNELSQISIEGFFKSFSSEEEDPFISLTPPTKASRDLQIECTEPNICILYPLGQRLKIQGQTKDLIHSSGHMTF